VEDILHLKKVVEIYFLREKTTFIHFSYVTLHRFGGIPRSAAICLTQYTTEKICMLPGFEVNKKRESVKDCFCALFQSTAGCTADIDTM